ncbi:hypothetical protein MKW98_009717 [Papaver atlanticum]|uniref:Uncharacterized protein n=1 Tax=Papaver atlanticum TaxID=357466 RepID=A0AAD4SWK9_9MAGN|nr:hypothetical protein MKW98_009717 [Papaver atlanticum]
MAKISMFISFFLFVLIAIPTSSSSRMILEEVEPATKCPTPDCSFVKCKPVFCLQVVLECTNYTPCCGCPTCCPA